MSWQDALRASAQADKLSVARRDAVSPESPSQGNLDTLRRHLETDQPSQAIMPLGPEDPKFFMSLLSKVLPKTVGGGLPILGEGGISALKRVVPRKMAAGEIGRGMEDVNNIKDIPFSKEFNVDPMFRDEMMQVARRASLEKPPSISMHPSNRIKDVLSKILTQSKPIQQLEKDVSEVAPTVKHAQFWIAQQLVSKARAGKATAEELSWLLKHGYGF